ncbi:hypothetical protein FVQ98_19340 [Ottowia sp. GY511]|uniref:Lipoprotein n=1 Tax=Ottowia flava TaxID=2675430 RepID=A0ABW4L1H9_9BURK|nr:hypothetical protein [Ottowia sp. GY511]TXK21377.1 hypothetical protein FVQ98_19340 [Ottowia sp. GY511]
MKKMLDSLLATYANSAIFGINIALLHIKTIFGRNWFFGRIVRKAMSANYARLTLVFAPVLLGGCFGGGDINIVKNAVWEAMPDTTIGKALDSRFSCTTPKWRQFEDERGRSIVEYTCEHKGVREYISRHSKEAFAARKQAVDNQLGRFCKTRCGRTTDLPSRRDESIADKFQRPRAIK